MKMENGSISNVTFLSIALQDSLQEMLIDLLYLQLVKNVASMLFLDLIITNMRITNYAHEELEFHWEK